MEKIVIIGGQAAGAGAAARARRLSEDASITIIEREPYLSLSSCGLPYYIGGEFASREALFLHTPRSFSQRYDTSVLTGTEVREIIRDKMILKICDLSSKIVSDLEYTKLIICSGSTPLRISIPGADLPGVFYLKGLTDAEGLMARLPLISRHGVLIAGGGYIGIELAEAFLKRGAKVIIVEKDKNILPVFDPEFSARIEKYLKGIGVEFITGTELTGISEADGLLISETGGGDKIKTGAVICNIGVRPSSGLAESCGLSLGVKGTILVDRHARTNDENILSAGDCSNAYNFISGAPDYIPLAGPAQKAARVAASNCFGMSEATPLLLGTSILRAGELFAGITGYSEKRAVREHIDVKTEFVFPGTRVHYMNGADEAMIKLVMDRKKNVLIGAEVLGRDKVDKYIDVFSSIIYNKMKPEEMKNLDLAYSPPVSTPRGPVGMASMVAENSASGALKSLSPSGLALMLSQGTDLCLLDVRGGAEFAAGSIKGAVNIPLPRLREKLGELDKSKKTVVYCKSGFRSYLAFRILGNSGFSDVLNLSGGYNAWQYFTGGER